MSDDKRGKRGDDFKNVNGIVIPRKRVVAFIDRRIHTNQFDQSSKIYAKIVLNHYGISDSIYENKVRQIIKNQRAFWRKNIYDKFYPNGNETTGKLIF